MNNKTSYLEVLYLAIGEMIASILIALIFYLTGNFDMTVIYGVLLGSLVTVVNFLFLIIILNKAIDDFIALRGDKEMDDEEAEKFAKEHTAKIQNATKLSLIVRSLSIVVCFVLAFALTDVFNVLATLIPLLLLRPILMVREAFRKKGV